MLVSQIGKYKYFISWNRINAMKEPEIDLEHVRRSRTEVIDNGYKSKAYHNYSIYRCTCGNLFECYEQSVKQGRVVSCGCKSHGNQAKNKLIQEL